MVFEEHNVNAELIQQTVCMKESCRFQNAFHLLKDKTRPKSRGLHYTNKTYLNS